ncbi:MAG: hypothetical protein CMP23_06070 [Rickettsiales bacterium]|nr:hypothetical protein [Rickettsiales bacterium]
MLRGTELLLYPAGYALTNQRLLIGTRSSDEDFSGKHILLRKLRGATRYRTGPPVTMIKLSTR